MDNNIINYTEVIIGYNASGAANAAKNGYAVLIVDVIDMSTSLEAALEGGAICVFGASPDNTLAPVQVDPYKIGTIAGQKASDLNTGVVIIAEPRWGSKEERTKNCKRVMLGITQAGAKVLDIVPNLGAEVGKATDFNGKIVVCVSDTGGVAYDAAWQYDQKVVTGTIARTLKMKGEQTAQKAAKRIMEVAKGRPIAVIAASSNSLEDILAASHICQLIIATGYLKK